MLGSGLLSLQELLHCGLVKFVGLAFNNLERAGGAGTQARAQAVAQFIRNQPRLAIDNAQRAFGAVGHALAAAVAELLIYFHDFPYRFHLIPFCSLNCLYFLLCSGAVCLVRLWALWPQYRLPHRIDADTFHHPGGAGFAPGLADVKIQCPADDLQGLVFAQSAGQFFADAGPAGGIAAKNNPPALALADQADVSQPGFGAAHAAAGNADLHLAGQGVIELELFDFFGNLQRLGHAVLTPGLARAGLHIVHVFAAAGRAGVNL